MKNKVHSWHKHGRLGFGLLLAMSLISCGGGGSGNNTGGTTYSVTASIKGLTSSGLALLVNGAQVPVSSGATSAALASNLSTGATYAVTVQTQPTGATCSVSNGSGTIGSSNVTNVDVSCTANTITVGGTITGLSASGLVLLNNGGDATTIAANAMQFVMATPIAYAGNYSITVKSPPAGETCKVSQGSGTDATANIKSVAISCAPWQGFVETVLYSFKGADDGADPTTSLIEGRDGNLYGTTGAGGANGSGGTVFRITTAGVLTVLHSFKNATFTDGSVPSGVVQASDGNFYGVTTYGGATGNGTVFQVTPAGAETVLYSFVNGLGDGFNPSGTLIQATDGNLYGTAPYGGAYSNGAIFKVSLSGQESILYSFNASANDGFSPGSGVIQASDGNLYGTTPGNGTNVNVSFGAVFKVTLSGQETLVYTFKGLTASDGQLPDAGVIQGSDGNFYGTTTEGGSGVSGTVFKLTPGGVETVLSNFNDGGSAALNGYNPVTSLLQASDGNLYGINNLGGAYNSDGTVYQVTPQGVTTLIYSFGANAGDGANSQANLIQASDGNFYGTTHAGGQYGYGAIIKITPQ
ncbi:MAG: hypothetical protein JSS29_19770 [Proteobacteria bacterium]|nr:hypothetical protein [Pseudomonadota bacterium]